MEWNIWQELGIIISSLNFFLFMYYSLQITVCLQQQNRSKYQHLHASYYEQNDNGEVIFWYIYVWYSLFINVTSVVSETCLGSNWFSFACFIYTWARARAYTHTGSFIITCNKYKDLVLLLKIEPHSPFKWVVIIALLPRKGSIRK